MYLTNTNMQYLYCICIVHGNWVSVTTKASAFDENDTLENTSFEGKLDKAQTCI